MATTSILDQLRAVNPGLAAEIDTFIRERIAEFRASDFGQQAEREYAKQAGLDWGTRALPLVVGALILWRLLRR